MKTAIETQDLIVEFETQGKKIRVIDGLNLCVKPGQVYGFIGPNGAGKTTTIHVLLGFIPPSAGEVRVLDADVRRPQTRQRIGYMAERPEAYRFLTGREFLRRMGYLFDISLAEARKRADKLLETVGLSGAASKRIALYSRGMLQRLSLAQALINEPELVILDEPTSGFDPLGRIEVRKIIENLRAGGSTVFFSSHELSEVEKVCDQIGIIIDGRLAVTGAVQDLVSHNESLERYFLELMTCGKSSP